MTNKISLPYTTFSAQQNKLPNMVRGKEIYLFDDEGNKFVDIVSSWWACALEHGLPKEVKAIQNQAENLQQTIGDFC